MRIVSLLPSATEIVCRLGLADDLVGVSHSCDYPPEVAGLPRVTRTHVPEEASGGAIDRVVRASLREGKPLYAIETQRLERLHPDLIVTQGLCQVCAVSGREVDSAAALLSHPVRVVSLEPHTLEDVLDTVTLIGEAAGCATQAAAVVEQLRSRLEQVRRAAAARAGRPRVALLEWLDPPFSAGHWNHELIGLAGGTDVLSDAPAASRTLSIEECVAADPEVVVAACCGWSRARSEAELPALRRAIEAVAPGWFGGRRLIVVDGNHYFSRPGPRLVESAEMLAHILDPSGFPLSRELRACVLEIDVQSSV